MRLIPDAHVAHRFWSVRLSLLAGAVGALEAALPYFAPAHASPRFGLLTAAVSLAAAGARYVAQPGAYRIRRRGRR